MKIFKHRRFQRWAKSEKIKDEALKKAIAEIEQGLCEVNLGSSLYKKRIMMPGKGKRGSYRAVLAFKHREKAFFVYGYAKNVKSDLTPKEINVYKDLAKILLSLNEVDLNKMVKAGHLIEVK